MADENEEIQFQATITDKTQWDEMLLTKGVVVIDVYQAWCGPCKAVVNLFRKLKDDFNEDNVLHFAVAEIDNIPALQPFRNTCEPVFLFCVNGKIIAIVRGVNVPLISKKITELVQEEREIAAGKKKRTQVDELVFLEEKSSEEDVDETGAEGVIIYSVGIIKPDDVSEGRVEEITQEIKDAGFNIEAAEEKMLTEEEIRDIYAQNKDEDLEDFVQFMMTGPCHILIISKKEESDVIPHWKELHRESEAEKQDSLEATMEWEQTLNMCDVQDSVEHASRHLGFFFPNFDMKETDQEVEKTLALITPSFLKERRHSIIQRLKDDGFKIAMQNEITLSEEQVREFYKEHETQNYFPALLSQMTSGPTLVLALTQENAVARWRDLLASNAPEEANEANSNRKQNADNMHGSSTPDDAQDALQSLPQEQTLALIKPAAAKHEDDIMQKIKSAGYTISKLKEAALTREMAVQFYKEHEEEPFFENLVDYMTEGPPEIMILTKKNAVEEWMQLMGPTDPELAKKAISESIRAKLAQDILSNAVHGTSKREYALKNAEFVFGEIHVD